MSDVMNICWCGAQAGYPHDVFCPFPLFGGSEKRQHEWQAQWETNRKAAQQKLGIKDRCCDKPLLSSDCTWPVCDLYIPRNSGAIKDDQNE